MGYITFSISTKNHTGVKFAKVVSIDAIGVKKDHRSGGIGKRLMDYVIDIAKKQNCTTMELGVTEENTIARKFYEKIGMTVKNIKYSKNI